MSSSLLLICTVATLLTAFVASASVQIHQTPGIVIPAHSIRLSRNSYGSNSGSSSSSYLAATPAYSSPVPTYSASSDTGYETPGPSSYLNPSSSSSYNLPVHACPANYMFGCEPALTPAPCAQSYSSYSSPQGSYSHYYPQYALPVVREVY